MKRLLGFVLGLVVLVLALLAPAALYDVDLDEPSHETTTITRYLADFEVDDQGGLRATETLTVTFPHAGKHGIFRFWDLADPTAPHARRIPREIRVTMDGSPVQVELTSEDGGRFRVARIGSPDIEVTPGEHVYEISYRIASVLEPGTDGTTSQFYWDLVPAGWQQPIERAALTLRLPAPAEQVRCAIGTGSTGETGSTGGCAVRGDDTTVLRIRTDRLAPNTPVTVKVGLAVPASEPVDELPWTPRWDAVLGQNVLLLACVLLLAAGASVLGLTIGARSREPRPQYPLMYAPPEGLGPAQAAYLFTEKVDRTAYVASLMHAAQHGAVRLDRNGDTWSITDLAGPQGWAGLDEVTHGVGHLLGGPGATFTASRSDVAGGQRLQQEIARFESSTRAWAKRSGLMVRSGLGSAGAIVVIGALLAALAIAIFNPFSMTLLGLVPGGFALFALPLLSAGSGTRRTARGRELWSRIGGFHRVLSTDSSQNRFDFSGRHELYTAYIPWAVALGCAEEWADKYRTEVGAEPPTPPYLVGGYAAGTAADQVSAMVQDFSRTVDGAISSYQATQTSSSSGGGGFSGGGGGGGGGGGSW